MAQNFKYLRNRPFLLVFYRKLPAEGQNPSMKEFGKNGVLDVREQTVVAWRVKDKDLREAHVIIDLVRGKIVKNGFSGTPNLEVFKHFMEKHQQKISQVLADYFAQNPDQVIDVNQLDNTV